MCLLGPEEGVTSSGTGGIGHYTGPWLFLRAGNLTVVVQQHWNLTLEDKQAPLTAEQSSSSVSIFPSNVLSSCVSLLCAFITF